MYQIILAVNHLHENKIIHRDIKPCNILIDEKADIKLADFGLSKSIFYVPQDLTNTVMTLFYRPPEMILGEKKYNFSADMWSLGCTLYKVVENQLMFEEKSDVGLLFKMFTVHGHPTM